MLSITYQSEPGLSAIEFQAVLRASTLSARRPADDLARLEIMLRQADVVITARAGATLVGVSRAITDFSFCCYLSDLAVNEAYQHQGIGRQLIEKTHDAAGPLTSLYLVAAPAAQDYYAKVPMIHHPHCWTLPRTS